MMKVNDYLAKAVMIADTCATMYMMGGHGHSLTWNDTFNELIRDYSYNQKHEKELREQFDTLKKDHPFAFDCCGLIKGIIWGFDAEYNEYGGGTVYQSNGLLDNNAEGLLEHYGYDVSDDFTYVTPGEMLYMKGHCGIYMGDGKVIESTPKWQSKVQWTKITDRKWLKHCKLSVIDYTKEEKKSDVAIAFKCPHCGKVSTFGVLTGDVVV